MTWKSPAPEAGARVRALDTVFFAGGAITLEQPLVLRFASGHRVPIAEDDGWQRDIAS